MPHPPLLYEINLRAALTAIGARLGRRASLDDLPDERLDRLEADGFGWLWLLGAWRTGPAGRTIARSFPQLQPAYRHALADLREEDICGSCFAVAGYEPDLAYGGAAALARLRRRLHRRGMRLMLDFVPNHTARDHPWTWQRPGLYRRGGEAEIAREPQNWFRAETSLGPAVLAHGRDPNFPGWTDTVQLDHANPETQATMRAELLKIAGLCDGLRCDMAMLLLPEVFERVWGERSAPFWPEAIAAVRQAHAGFTFLAEAYWDLEWTLLQQGFDHAYDKRLYDRLRAGTGRPVRDHLGAEPSYQRRLARFLENHDEERAAAAFPAPMHRAAALIAYLSPGLKFFQDGQLEGRRIRLPIQLCRAPEEPPDGALSRFYAALLEVLKAPALRNGKWRLLESEPNGPIAFLWRSGREGLLIAVNYADGPGRLEARLDQAARTRLRLAEGQVRGAGADLEFELPAWGYAAVELDFE